MKVEKILIATVGATAITIQSCLPEIQNIIGIIKLKHLKMIIIEYFLKAGIEIG
jgi:hypothetical protein